MLARRELRERRIEWLYRQRYSLAPTDPRFLDATDLDMRLDLYMHLEHADNLARAKGQEVGHTDTAANAVTAFERLAAREAAGEEIDDEMFDRLMHEEWDAADAIEGTSLDPAHEALRELLGDRYHPEDFRIDEAYLPAGGDEDEEG